MRFPYRFFFSCKYNKSHLRLKGLALGLVLKKRQNVTWSEIALLNFSLQEISAATWIQWLLFFLSFHFLSTAVLSDNIWAHIESVNRFSRGLSCSGEHSLRLVGPSLTLLGRFIQNDINQHCLITLNCPLARIPLYCFYGLSKQDLTCASFEEKSNPYIFFLGKYEGWRFENLLYWGRRVKNQSVVMVW